MATKFIRRSIFAVAASMVAAFSLSGCGGDDSSGSVVSTAAASSPSATSTASGGTVSVAAVTSSASVQSVASDSAAPSTATSASAVAAAITPSMMTTATPAQTPTANRPASAPATTATPSATPASTATPSATPTTSPTPAPTTPAASVQLSAASYSVAQSAGALTVTVTRTGDVTGAVGVSYATVAGTAVAGTNYTNASGTLNWAANDSAPKTFSISIAKSPALTSPSSFKVGLSATTYGVTLGTPATATITITPAATSSATSSVSNAAALESYLAGLNKGTGQRVLSGQHADIWNSDLTSATQPMDVVTPDVGMTGVNPAILGLVLNYATNSYAYTVDVTNTLANQWWSKGGLVMLSIYSNDPTFSYNTSGQPEGKSIPSSNFHQLTDTTSAAYKQWHSQLDTYAAALHTLTDSGHVVLLRPFIELNGNWNWYGAENAADFIAVWKDMHDYMMNTKGLKNVLWIYNVNAQNGGYTDYYPGADYVDIVGMDIYDDPSKIVADVNSGNMYNELVAIGKPLIFPEIGLSITGSAPQDSLDDTAIIKIIKASLPNVVGFLDWNGSIAICNQNNASALLNDPWVINLSTIASSTSGL